MVLEELVTGGKEDNDTARTDVVEAASEMGIMCFKDNSEKICVDKNNVDEVDNSTNAGCPDTYDKLSFGNMNAEINISTCRTQLKESKSGTLMGSINNKRTEQGAFDQELQLKEEEPNFDEDNVNADDKDDKDFVFYYRKKKNENKGKDRRKSDPGSIKDVSCDVCGKAFLTIGIRNEHMKTVHAVSKPFSCSQCDKSFSTAGIRKTHIRNIHSKDDVLQLPCEECGKMFPHAKSLNQHVEVVHKSRRPSPSPCPQCAKPVRYLKTHLQHAHSTNRNFGCEECGKMFKSKSDVTDHKKSHLPEDIKLLMKSKQMEKNQCEICGQGFVDKTRLNRHIAIKHTGVRSFLCHKCPASYFRSDHLRNHVTTNHEETNIIASTC